MLSISQVGLTSEKAFQGLFSWVWSLYPQPCPPPFIFNANILFYSVCLRPVMIAVVPVQALSEWILCGVLDGTVVAEWCRQNSFFSVMEGEACSFQLTATDTLWPLQALPRQQKAQDQCKNQGASAQWCHNAEPPSITPLQSHIPRTVNENYLHWLNVCALCKRTFYNQPVLEHWGIRNIKI